MYDFVTEYNTVIDPPRWVPGIDEMSVSFNIQNSGDLGSGNWIYLKVPPEFTLPGSWDDLTIELIEGS